MQFENGITVVVAVIRKEDRILINSRPEGKEKAGWWEFPGGKVEHGESHDQALKREVLEELAFDVEVGELLMSRAFTWLNKRERPVSLFFYECDFTEGKITPQEDQSVAWVTIEELLETKFLPTNWEVVRLLSGR